MDNSEKKTTEQKQQDQRKPGLCSFLCQIFFFVCVCEQQSAHLCLASGWFLGFLKKLHLFQSSQEYISILI